MYKGDITADKIEELFGINENYVLTVHNAMNPSIELINHKMLFHPHYFTNIDKDRI